MGISSECCQRPGSLRRALQGCCDCMFEKLGYNCMFSGAGVAAMNDRVAILPFEALYNN